MIDIVAKTQWDWLVPKIIFIAARRDRESLEEFLDYTARESVSNCARRAHNLITGNSNLPLATLVERIKEMAATDGWEKES